MKVTFDWLKDHLKTDLKEKNLLEQLTNIGFEMKALVFKDHGWRRVRS